MHESNVSPISVYPMNPIKNNNKTSHFHNILMWPIRQRAVAETSDGLPTLLC